MELQIVLLFSNVYLLAFVEHTDTDIINFLVNLKFACEQTAGCTAVRQNLTWNYNK